MLEDILLQVNKPARYIGQEWNLPKKDFAKAEVKFALCFPDLYEVGMSNLGIRIIYGILNNLTDVICERFFSVDMDMERILRNQGREIFSLESGRGLREFDLVGFSLAYELNYTNVLNILELGNIPLQSSLRDCAYPLVIGGGSSVLNPEPMHEFFDLFIIGEAEEAILEIIGLYRKFKSKFKAGQISKEELLVMFSAIEGVYAPSLYEAAYNQEGKLEEFRPKVAGAPKRIKKRFLGDLDHPNLTLDWLVPYIQIIHDRITLEIMRGCPNRCRFCQARNQYFPFRQRPVKNILDSAEQIYKRSGYEEISLSGLSVSDYTNIEELLESLITSFKAKGISVSLPSLKPKTLLGGASALIATVKKTGLTFAPEAGSERLRRMLGKDFHQEEFFKVIEDAYLAGYQHVKLYFMLGLPFEEKSDLDAIIDFSRRVSELRNKTGKGKAGVNISVNTLIPKPHTSFQWFKMEDLESIKYKQDYLRGKARGNRKLNLSFHNRYMSILEGIISRGDRRLSEVILCAFKKGARFDAWSNHFSFQRWLDSFAESGIEPYFYLEEKSKEENLAWDFIDLGIDKESLWNEFQKVVAMQ